MGPNSAKLYILAVGSEGLTLKTGERHDQTDGGNGDTTPCEARKKFLDFMRKSNLIRGLQSSLRQIVKRNNCPRCSRNPVPWPGNGYHQLLESGNRRWDKVKYPRWIWTITWSLTTRHRRRRQFSWHRSGLVDSGDSKSYPAHLQHLVVRRWKIWSAAPSDRTAQTYLTKFEWAFSWCHELYIQ